MHSERGKERKKEKGGRKSEGEEGRELKIDFSQRGSVCSLTSVISTKKGKNKDSTAKVIFRRKKKHT